MNVLNRGPTLSTCINLAGLAQQARSLLSLPSSHPARPFLLAVEAVWRVQRPCSAKIDTESPQEQAQLDLQIGASYEFVKMQFDSAMELILQNPVADDNCNSEHMLRYASYTNLSSKWGQAKRFLIEIDSSMTVTAHLPKIFISAVESALGEAGSRTDDVAEYPAAVAAFEIVLRQATKSVDDLIAAVVQAST